MKRTLITLTLALLAGCPSSETPDDLTPTFDAVGQLEENLVGVFDSAQQSIDDPQYFAIQLITCPVHAPDLGERVVYVEQAVMGSADAPYRQRLYVLQGDDVARIATTTVYALTDPQSAIGLCDGDLATFAFDEVTRRAGCGVAMEWDEEDEAYVGGTAGTSCLSTMNGATHATAEVWIGADRIESWDRGFDGNGEQVWGAEAGPYEFLRQD